MQGDYPDGMTTSDLMHVGEIQDPFDTYFENWEDLTEEQLTDWIEENPEKIAKAINDNWTYNDYLNAWKDDNSDFIQGEWENDR